MTNGEKFKEVFGFGADGNRVIAVNTTWWDCEFQDRKPITNAGRIRSMSPEELAEWLAHLTDCVNCPCRDPHDQCDTVDGSCQKQWLDWLKKEAEKDEIY